ncbi:MAG TPA: hypothetical protein DIT64_02460 [Verrucomicrobiales bacterium]|nr:hypothetical protein [Verrucomicrobiales bacterium]
MAACLWRTLIHFMEMPDPQVIIIGAGPAGCTLAALLAMRGVECLVFDDDKRPGLLVGESLIPGVVPVFQRLGIEERVAAMSVRKPGASFFAGPDGPRIHFKFKNVEGHLPPYSFNTPRPELDNLLRRRAEELGARFVHARAELEACERGGQSSVSLSSRSRAQAGLSTDAEPLLVDASGRARVFSRLMGLGAKKGGRDDVAHFAHFEDFEHDEVEPGQVIISVLKAGWSWRIPLPGRLSVGIVVGRERAKELGATPEERLERAIAQEPLLREKGARARRVTPVMTYTNYQLLSERGHGPGWVLLGDAFGFVDPMLSPGLFMSLEGARLLDERVFARGADILDKPEKLARALDGYAREVVRWHGAWMELVEYFYNGRIFQMHLAGRDMALKPAPFDLASRMERHTTFHLASMASGGMTRSAYSRGLIRFLSKHLVWGVPAAANFAVRDACAPA